MSDERAVELLNEIVRLLALTLRRDMENQQEAILAFLQAGLEPGRVAELIGTTPATVRAARLKAAKRVGKKGAA
jgi:hypothetical protein